MTQPTIFHVQAAHLAMMNYQMHQQHQMAAWQANLQQALHETEQTARRVYNTMQPDPFAAAAIAGSWLQRVQGLHVSQFHDLQAKRAWSEAYGLLDGAVRAARNDSRGAQELDSYLRLMDTMGRYQSHFSGDPDHYVAQLNAGHDRIGKGWIWLGAVAFLALLAVLVFATGGKDRGTGFIWLVLAVIPLYLYWQTQRQLSRSADFVIAGQRVCTDYKAFMADPAAGGWLQTMWSQHPALFQEPIPTGPVSSGRVSSSHVHVERKLVERQIVVVRCKFCKQLSPVDLPTCEHCGSPGFGSSQ